MTEPASIVAVVAVTVATVVIGARGVRVSRTPEDFLVAARQVPPTLNASAISGEYLSAASFLGIAGLAMLDGLGALWYAVGYAAGYLVLLAAVAAPLRRFGAYTIPDFAEGRLNSPILRRAGHGHGAGHLWVLPAAPTEGSRSHAPGGSRRVRTGWAWWCSVWW